MNKIRKKEEKSSLVKMKINGQNKGKQKKKKNFLQWKQKITKKKKKSLVKGKGKISRINMKMKVGQQTQ